MIIDADGHVCEPPDHWTSRMPPKWGELIPRYVTSTIWKWMSGVSVTRSSSRLTQSGIHTLKGRRLSPTVRVRRRDCALRYNLRAVACSIDANRPRGTKYVGWGRSTAAASTSQKSVLPSLRGSI